LSSSALPPGRGLAPIPAQVHLAPVGRRVDRRRISFILLGAGLFASLMLWPSWPAAVDPAGHSFALTREGRASIAVFALALVWWVFEVVPIGVTAIAIGVAQALLRIRPAKAVFGDFLDPSVWFVVGSLVVGLVFTRTGLTKRVAYRVLVLTGERTRMVYLGCFLMTAAMATVMAHTAVAAAVFPLLSAIHSTYEEDGRPTRFGKGLFIGMALAAGAGSIATLMGSGRGALAVGLFREMAGRDVSFFEFSWYLLPVAWVMVLLFWGFCTAAFPPERPAITGLRERARHLHSRLGPISRDEIVALAVLAGTVGVMAAAPFVPALAPLDKSAVILVSTVAFFLLGILALEDLEQIPWNIVLLFGGAMSLGLCLWQTGAATWMAVHLLARIGGVHWFAFVMGAALVVLALTNVILNVAVIALCLPVAVVIAGYLGLRPDVVLYACLVTAGTPFVLLIGAAPNAIAYGSGQFTPGEFSKAGVPASALVALVLAAFVWLVWPLMGMPVPPR
jgi:sodium-dependent dicarboxylate transporter 2/3/5